QSFLVGEILLPREIRRVHPLLEPDPLFSGFSSLDGTIARHATRWVSRAPSIGKGTRIGWILQHLIDGRLRGGLPEHFPSREPSRLAARKPHACFPQDPSHSPTAPLFVKGPKDQG